MPFFFKHSNSNLENVCDLEVFPWNPARRNINIRCKKRVSIPNIQNIVSVTVCQIFVHYP